MSILMWRCLSSPLQEPEPLFKVCVDKLVEELRLQKLSEPHVIERKWAGGRIWLIDEVGAALTLHQRVAWVCSSWRHHLNIENLPMLLDLEISLLEQWDCGADMNKSHSKGLYGSMCLGSITQARNEGKTPWEVVILVPMLVYKNKVNFSEACLLCWREQFGTTWGRCWVGFPWLVVGQCVGASRAPWPLPLQPWGLLPACSCWGLNCQTCAITPTPHLSVFIINMKLHSSCFRLHSLIQLSLRFYLLFILYWVQPPHDNPIINIDL